MLMTLSPDDQAKMEKANPHKPVNDVRFKAIDMSYKTGLHDGFNEGYTACHKDNAETITTLREQLEAEKQWNGKLSGKVLYYHMYIKTRDERDRLREGIESLQNLLVCGPIADPSEILETAFHMIEALTPQPADYFEQPTQGTAPAITPRKSTKRIVGKVTPADTPCPECGGSGLKYPAPIIETREDVPKCQLCNGTGKAQPCKECGTVGGGGRVRKRGLPGMKWVRPCPRCGA